jgi:hypothetical protein
MISLLKFYKLQFSLYVCQTIFLNAIHQIVNLLNGATKIND